MNKYEQALKIVQEQIDDTGYFAKYTKAHYDTIKESLQHSIAAENIKPKVDIEYFVREEKWNKVTNESSVEWVKKKEEQ